MIHSSFVQAASLDRHPDRNDNLPKSIFRSVSCSYIRLMRLNKKRGPDRQNFSARNG
jgi:hypothetical protein